MRQSIEDALRKAGIEVDIEPSSAADSDRLFLDDECYLDLASACVVRSDASFELSPAEVTLIQRLCSPRGAWRTTAFLAGAIGRTDAAGPTLVWKYISRIKAKLGSTSEAIEHVRNKGYRWR
jgi:DNA-binding response OmpR family regulator